MDVVKLDFKKTKEGNTNLSNKENLDKLLEYIFPIIEENEGWGTGDLTKEKFLENPEKYQDHINASTWDNVHVFTKGGKPVALFEFSKTELSDKKNKVHRYLGVIFSQKKHIHEIEEFVGRKLDKIKLKPVKKFLEENTIYTSYEVTIKPNLQGKKSGIAETMYKLVEDGILFGWTSSPIIVRLHRRLYKNTLFFPPFDEFPNDIEEWAACLYVYADRLEKKKKKFKNLKFGTMYDTHFVEDRGEKYLKIAKKMREQGKISKLDEKRIEYVLSRKYCAAAIVSWN